MFNLTEGSNTRTFRCDGNFTVFKVGDKIYIMPDTKSLFEDTEEAAFGNVDDNYIHLFSLTYEDDTKITGREHPKNRPSQLMYDCYIVPLSDGMDYNIVIRYSDNPASYYCGRYQYNEKNATAVDKLRHYVEEYIIRCGIDKIMPEVEW